MSTRFSTPDKENAATEDSTTPQNEESSMDPMSKLRHLLSSMNNPSNEQQQPVTTDHHELNSSKNAVTVENQGAPDHILDATCLWYNKEYLLRSMATGRTISIAEDDDVAADESRIVFHGEVEGLGLGKEKESLIITTGNPIMDHNHHHHGSTSTSDAQNVNEEQAANETQVCQYNSILKYGDTISIRSRAANDQALSVRKQKQSPQNYEVGFYRTWLSQSEKFIILPSRMDGTCTVEQLIALRIPVRAGDEVLLLSVSTSGLLECVKRLKSNSTDTNNQHSKVVKNSLNIFPRVSFGAGENGQMQMMSMASGKPGSNQTWQIMPAGLPLLPPWNYNDERPYLSFDFLLDANREARKVEGSTEGNDVADLEKILLNEMLDALMGFEGSLIRCVSSSSSSSSTSCSKREKSPIQSAIVASNRIPQHCGINFIGPEHNLRFEISTDVGKNGNFAASSVALLNLVQRMLPLCSNFVGVEAFISSRITRYEYGLVAHAFASAVDALVKEYLVLVAQLEALMSDNRLSLQKLWCFVQPSIRTFAVLANMIDKTRCLKGGALLNIIDDALCCTADEKSCEILNFLLQSASVPYFEMLTSWVWTGELHDVSEEFMVDATTHRYTAAAGIVANDIFDYNSDTTTNVNLNYWDDRYTIRPQHVLHILSKQELQILTIGKYLNVIRECRKAIINPLLLSQHDDAKNSSEVSASSSFIRLEFGVLAIQSQIDAAFEFAASTLLTLVMKEHMLLDRLRSMKKYFLLDQGDFFVQFLDVAESELIQDLENISRDRIQSLLAMSIQTNVPDPFRDDLICDFAPLSLVDHLDSMYSWSGGLGTKEPKTPSRHTYGSKQSLTGIEAFMLDYKVEWPLSLVISRKAIINYQLLFRHLFFCKHVERRLFSTWLDHQTIKELKLRGELGKTYCLRQRMLHFLQNFVYYMMFEVIEPRWQEMEKRFGDAKTIDDVLGVHEDFQNAILKECLLTSQDLLKILAKLMSTCLLFSEQMRRFFEATNIDEEYEQSAINERLRRFNLGKPQRLAKLKSAQAERRQQVKTRTERLRVELNSSAYRRMLNKFEQVFDSLLGEFMSQLLSDANAHYHSHLSSLGTRLDYNGYVGSMIGGI
eukprot:CAMPEP_0116025846 /NCGR_PEP_ID=MMETSP0321-20121206/13383_1 /TAXON_ID=163516 /ORGANISM="Leptocylindrus danicus var. danicus, Strain B650" /LENGTH=1111 /DNA_ID=CAMNT_0003498301 /DNA_START=289 /DNA_END=3624 /DNA_ORIENTATION=-